MSALVDMPGGLVEVESVWSNADGVVDREVEAQLREGGCYAGQPAWDYYGLVWFDVEDGVFYEKVMQYKTHVATVSAATIDELKAKMGEEFGTR